MSVDVDAFAAHMADELNNNGALRYKTRVPTVAGLIAAGLRDALEQRPVEYAVHRVVDGRVCPDACGTATIRKEKR